MCLAYLNAKSSLIWYFPLHKHKQKSKEKKERKRKKKRKSKGRGREGLIYHLLILYVGTYKSRKPLSHVGRPGSCMLPSTLLSFYYLFLMYIFSFFLCICFLLLTFLQSSCHKIGDMAIMNIAKYLGGSLRILCLGVCTVLIAFSYILPHLSIPLYQQLLIVCKGMLQINRCINHASCSRLPKSSNP